MSDKDNEALATMVSQLLSQGYENGRTMARVSEDLLNLREQVKILETAAVKRLEIVESKTDTLEHFRTKTLAFVKSAKIIVYVVSSVSLFILADVKKFFANIGDLLSWLKL